MRTLIFLSILLSFSSGLSAQKSTIKETTMSFPTYGYGDPNPIAKPGKIYPYYRFDGYTNTAVDKEWKVIVMENDWIKVLIAPEIGGKVLGAIEKSTGNEFLYYNKVIKFRDVAMRGAWTSGGIEFNFGSIGHAPSTSSPVNYLIKENSDGSVSCFLGDMDLSSRTEWRVEVRLPADKAWFETRAFWYNPTDFSTSKYQWMNAAADASDDMKYYWPGTNYIGHPGDVHAWPIMEDGRDISQYAQNDYGTYHSYHVLGEISDYYGGYYHNKDFGFGHLTDYAIKPGKKIWIWGLARQGEIWVDLLTNPELGNGQYTEIQTGILFNQAAVGSTKTPYKHLSFDSNTEERFTEYWFPVKETGGISDINEYGILHVQDTKLDDGLDYEFRFCALQAVRDSVHVTINGNLCYSFWVDIQPMEVFSTNGRAQFSEHSIQKGIKFELYLPSLTKEGQVEDMPRHSDRPTTSPEFDWNSLQGKYYAALENARQREFEKALKGFYKCLEEDKNHIPSLIGAAEESLRIQKTDQAQNLIRRVLSIDTYHAQANYLYGIVKKQKQEYHRASEAFGICLRDIGYRSRGYIQLAEVSILQGNYKKAVRYADEALAYNAYSTNALFYKAVAMRKQGLNSRFVLDALDALDPLNMLSIVERALLTDSDYSEILSQKAQNEFPTQNFIEIITKYYSLGQTVDLEAFLNGDSEYLDPVMNYWIAYLKSERSYPEQQIKESLLKAVDANAELVFPFRTETKKVLEWAEKEMPSWKNRYYLALMNWNTGNLDEARKLFRSCKDEPQFAGFYLSRTRIFEGRDTELVVHDLERALQVDPKGWRGYKFIVDFYMKHRAYPQALEYARKGARVFPDNFIIQVALAKVELYNGNFKKTLKILDDQVILPAEGAQEGHDIYRQAHLLQAVEEYKKGKVNMALEHIKMAREWPEHLGVGRAYETDERVEDYLEGIILMSEEKDEKASEAFRRVITYTEKNKPSWDSPYLLLAYSYQILGQETKSIKILSDWIISNSKDPIANWAGAMYANKKDRAEKALSNYKLTAGGTPWNPQGNDSQFRLVYEIVNEIQLK